MNNETIDLDTRRKELREALEHQKRLLRDARECGLRSLADKRRSRLRQIRRLIEDIDRREKS
jgi:hypothetical protein